VGYLHSYAEGERDEDRGEDHGEEDYSGMLNEDEVYLLQCRIDDFQQCLEEVEERYFLLRAGGKPKSEEPKPVPEDKQPKVEEIEAKEEPVEKETKPEQSVE